MRCSFCLCFVIVTVVPTLKRMNEWYDVGDVSSVFVVAEVILIVVVFIVVVVVVVDDDDDDDDQE